MIFHPTIFQNLEILDYQKATNDWILYIDADERVSKDLKKEIEKFNN